MIGAIGILGCYWVVGCAIVAAAAAIVGTGVTIKNGVDASAAARKQASDRKAFEDKQLRLHKADKTRQELINRIQLRRTRGQVMSSVALQEIAMQHDARESGRLRRDNALNGRGLDLQRTSVPRTGYPSGRPVAR